MGMEADSNGFVGDTQLREKACSRNISAVFFSEP